MIATGLALHVTQAPARTRVLWRTVLLVTLAQGLVGYTQYFTKLPEVLVAVHMLGACLLVVALSAAVLSLRERPV